MVDRQQIDILRSRMNSIDGQTAAAQVHLFELVEKHGLDSRDTFWHLGPIDSSVALDYPLTDEEGHAFQKMSDKERNAFDKEKREKLEAEQRAIQDALPPEVRTALVRFNELKDARFSTATNLATAMYDRGLVGLIADELGLQQDSEVELYLKR